MRFKSKILLLLLLGTALSGVAQSSLTRTVADAATRAPIPYAYVYHADARRTGTLTNTDGRFYLPQVKPADTLVVSHIGYAPYRVVVGEIRGDTLFLTEKVTTLAEVIILGVDSLSLYELVKANLEKNHGVGPVTYDVFARSFQYDRPGSELYTVQEMVMKVHHDSKHKVKVNFERARSRAFVDEDKSVSHHLVFELIRPFDDNLMDWDIWEKKVFKKYTLTIDGTVAQDERTLVRLVFTSKEDTNRLITFYIDQQTYAVVRYNYTYGDGKRGNDTFFREVNGKWYLSHSTSLAWLIRTPKNSPSFTTGHEQFLVYNVSDNKEITDDFKGYMTVHTDVLVNWEKTLDPWDHPFWQTYRNIPLPAWIQAVVDKN